MYLLSLREFKVGSAVAAWTLNLVCNIDKHPLKGQRCLYESNQLYDELGGRKEKKQQQQQKTDIHRLKKELQILLEEILPRLLSFYFILLQMPWGGNRYYGQIERTLQGHHSQGNNKADVWLLIPSFFLFFFFFCGCTELVKDYHLIPILFMELLLLIKLYLIFQQRTSSSVFIGTDFLVQHSVTE